MAVSRMLKIQLLGHSAVKDEIKDYLREAGVVEITDVSRREEVRPVDEDAARALESALEHAEASIAFLEDYSVKPSFFEKLSLGPLRASKSRIEELSAEFEVERIWRRCEGLAGRIRSARDGIADAKELVSSLMPWIDFDVPLEQLSSDGYAVQFWTVDSKAWDRNRAALCEKHEYCELCEFDREEGKSYISVIMSEEDFPKVLESFKELGAHHHAFDDLVGVPGEIIKEQSLRIEEMQKEIGGAEDEARELSSSADALRILADHYREHIALEGIDEKFQHTESTFLIEGWMRARDRRSLEQGLSRNFKEIELYFRDPADDEDPPVALDNSAAAEPFQFVTTLYGRPVYREKDPTPLLAPFFVLFFAMCLTDAGYGITLAALSALILIKFKPSGGAGLLLKVLLLGGLATSVVGLVAGGVFGISAESLPQSMQRFVFIDPLKEPMKMLNISFLMGLVHMLFGMGIRMAANFRGRQWSDALFDDLFWMLFLIALAPLGYAVILGGYVAPGIMNVARWSTLVIAAVLFLTGGRRQRSPVKKVLTGLIRFYDVVGYFGDVLSYARLLALGLATSAIAIAVNDIAGMVKGMPFYTGYVIMVLILVGGHVFNLAVNTLGAFVHSGRLQYLEFFSKFFKGGGREFRPFRHERRYSVMDRNEDR